jgi:hypothetical protein
MDNDEKLEEFIQVLGRINGLLGEDVFLVEGFDLTKTIEQMRLAGEIEDADELARLLERAEELKAQHQAQL